MRPRFLVNPAGGPPLDPVVTHGGCGVETVDDVLRREVLDEARFHGVGRPDAGVAVGLQLESNRARLLALAVPADARVGPDEVLDVVAVLVSDHVRLGERAATRAELRA